MPDFFDEIKRAAEEAGQAYNGTKTFNGSNIDVAMPLSMSMEICISTAAISQERVLCW
jgi:hypothetical protein